eukprot:TRINITY_DN3417_c0_g1_i5.p1 TRINITY_DN3417_c0_g1~~TRINITY_DN3417_c0_g1_i5.p1  ORF type:complete len:131 (-),score=9.95 TRINITY_DN3417_c0_g1_i5:58-450(-)
MYEHRQLVPYSEPRGAAPFVPEPFTPPPFMTHHLPEPELVEGVDDGAYGSGHDHARWGPRSPDKFIPRGAVRREHFRVVSPTGVGLRYSPNFDDRIPGEEVPVDSIVSGLAVTGDLPLCPGVGEGQVMVR